MRFQGVNSFFALSPENEGDRKVHTGYYFPKSRNNRLLIEETFLINQLKVILERLVIFEKF